jgi:3-oxoacyl-[acyl-carrier-protein] synthase III
MSALHLETWERPLLSLAYEARNSAVAPAAIAVGDNDLLISARLTTERILNEIGVPRSAHSVNPAAVGCYRSSELAQQSGCSGARGSVSHLPTPDSPELRPAAHL